MSNIIKCPICHEMAGLRYNENRVYQSRCQNMACRETVTVTAPSWVEAEQLFSRFEQASVQPNTTIVNHDIVFNPTGNEFDEARDQLLGTYKLVKIEDWEYKFIKQPKLSIPKKIAEEVEKVNRNRYTGAEEFSDVVYDWLYDPKFLGISEVSEEEYKKTGWVYSQTDRHEMNKLRNKRENIIRAYLAGKALGVELVEVEG